MKYWQTTFIQPGWGHLRWYPGREDTAEQVYMNEKRAELKDVIDVHDITGNPHYEAFAAVKTPSFQQLMYTKMTEEDWKQHALLAAANAQCRVHCSKQYSWAVPTPAVIDYIRAIHQKESIYELGAGSGYFARMITGQWNHPEYVATDDYSSHVFTHRYYNVRENPLEPSPQQNLFLCWPSYAEDWAYKALLAYTPNRVIYIGEGAGGCTADDAFHELLNEQYTEVEGLPVIDQYEGLHDRFEVWEKK